MHKIVNSINNAFRYQKDCFKVKKNSKTTLFLKCLVKSNIIRYFKEIDNQKVDGKFIRGYICGYINPLNNFEIKLLSKGGRKAYLGNPKLKVMDIYCFFVLSNNLKKSYINCFDRSNKMSGELVAKIFI
jgi:ribosomal protein S8